jgi:cell division protein FtsL
MPLSPQATGLHVRGARAWDDVDTKGDRPKLRGDRWQSARAQCEAQGMARRVRAGKREAGRGTRRRVGGRSLLALLLLGFFVVATGVIARRTFGISQARAIRALDGQRDAANAARVRLEAEIRDVSSRAKLGPIAERRLQMYVPADSQVIILPRLKTAPRQ